MTVIATLRKILFSYMDYFRFTIYNEISKCILNLKVFSLHGLEENFYCLVVVLKTLCMYILAYNFTFNIVLYILPSLLGKTYDRKL